MVKMRFALLAVLVLMLASFSGVLAQDEAAGTIVDVAAGDENFSTLVSLVEQAGLVDVLADPEAQWTVFAPTNDAFAALPQFAVDYVTSDPELLTRVLTYHVLEGAVTSDQITESMMAASMEMTAVGADTMGSELNVEVNPDGGITVNGANVVTPDIQASNGVIHVIDQVLIPPVELPAVTPAAVTGDIISNGSSTVEPVSLAINARFAEEGYTGQSTVLESGTGGGMRAFCIEGSSDIANASRPIETEGEGEDNELASCQAIGREPLEFRVGTDALAVVVNAENTWVTDLTVEQLAEVFTAENWSDLSFATEEFPAEPIQRFIPGTASGTFDYFVEEVFEEDPEPLLGAINTSQSESDNVLVQGIQGSPYAIGFFGYAYYAENADTLKILSVDGVEASEANVNNGTYPLARPLFIYTTAQILQEKPQVAAFVNYFLTNVNDVYESGEVAYFAAPDNVLNRSRFLLLAATNGAAGVGAEGAAPAEGEEAAPEGEATEEAAS